MTDCRKLILMGFLLIPLLTLPVPRAAGQAIQEIKITGVYEKLANELLESDAPDGQTQRTSMRQLIREFTQLEIPESSVGVSESDLSEQQLTFMKAHAREVISIKSFIDRGGLRGARALGVDNYNYRAVVKAFELQNFFDAYDELKINYRKDPDHRDKFLRQLSDGQRPVVMFVPDHALTYSNPHPSYRGWTKAELEWLFAHPEKMRNFTFVFGINQLITPEMAELSEKVGLHPYGVLEALLQSVLLANFHKSRCEALVRH